MRSGGEKEKKRDDSLSFFPLLYKIHFFLHLNHTITNFFLLFLPPRKEGEIKKKKVFFRNDPSAGSPTERIWNQFLANQELKLELSIARISSSDFL